MERQATEMSAKRADLEAQMTDGLQLEDSLLQEARKLADKREAMEASMRRDEEDLRRITEDAKRLHIEKVAREAAVMADEERQASDLAAGSRTAQTFVMQRPSALCVEEFISEELPQSCNGVISTRIQWDELGPNPLGEKDARSPGSPDTLNRRIRTTSDRSLPDCLGSMMGVPGSRMNTGDTGYRGGPRNGSADSSASTPLPQDQNRQRTIQHLEGDSAICTTLNGGESPDEALLEEDVFHSNICAQCTIEQADMSAAHLAAAAGHVECLDAINVRNPELMTKLDPAGRSPLFYACAAGHVGAVDLLIREDPCCCHLVDTNKDTPLHAAALAGSALSCRLLLQQGHVEVEPRNIMYMTPAHLAANNEVLDVLWQHGADLNAKVSGGGGLGVKRLRADLLVGKCHRDRVDHKE